MAKKKKRSPSMRTASASSRASSRASSNVEFEPDYSHVKKDLVRIGTLAGSFFALLIVLSFILK